MEVFQRVEGASAVLRKNGVFREYPIHSFDDYLFAKVGHGFVRLEGERTSDPTQRVVTLVGIKTEQDKLGRTVRLV